MVKDLNKEKYFIKGGRKLSGSIYPATSKNATLPILAASLLADSEVIIHNAPKIQDVYSMLDILNSLGVKTSFIDNTLAIYPNTLNKFEIKEELGSKLRSSIFLMGPMLAKYRKVIIGKPGGCNIGTRPIDIHLDGLKSLNVDISLEKDILCDGSNMKNANIYLRYPSVGATLNLMMACVFLENTSCIYNPAKEPEIVDVQNFINAMGGKISGAGTDKIEITGVKSLKGVEYTPILDRIEVGTYLILTAMTGGKIEILGSNIEHYSSLITKLKNSTCKISYKNGTIYLTASKRLKSVSNIDTGPYPCFPTDLQSQMLSMQCISSGISYIKENMFETRFNQVTELQKMGANITIKDNVAIVKGVPYLVGANLIAKDLRGGASLVLAALAAKGESIVEDIYHIDRGYENFEGTLKKIGADIVRI